MTQEEHIKINLETIEHIDKIIELRKQQVVELNKLKHSMMIKSRALNPVFWLEGKKIQELKILYSKENEIRMQCGLEPMPIIRWGADGVKKISDWIIVEKSKWQRNRSAILQGMENMIA